jgi:hypothetical protein
MTDTEQIDNRLRELLVDMPKQLEVLKSEKEYYQERYELLLARMLLYHGKYNGWTGELDVIFPLYIPEEARKIVEKSKIDIKEDRTTSKFWTEGLESFFLKMQYVPDVFKEGQAKRTEMRV